MPKIVECIECHGLLPHYAKGMCRKCYSKRYVSDKERKAKHAEDVRKWRADNPEKARAIEERRSKTDKRLAWRAKYNREYYAKNAEALRQYQRDWRRNNPRQRDAYKRAYVERVRNLPNTLTENEWQDILEQYHHLCAYCERGDIELYEEHWIPVCRGGGRTKENIVPACQRCNSRKGVMTGNEFHDLLDLEEWEFLESLFGVCECAY